MSWRDGQSQTSIFANLEMLEWIQESWLSQLLSGSTWGYPITGGVHVLAIALFGGSVLAANLRILGWGIWHEPAATLHAQLKSLKLTGFIVVMLTGALLFWSQPVRYYGGLFFKIKILLLLLLAANAMWFRFRYQSRVHLENDATAPIGAKLSAYLSLLLWLGVILSSRGIAFL